MPIDQKIIDKACARLERIEKNAAKLEEALEAKVVELEAEKARIFGNLRELADVHNEASTLVHDKAKVARMMVEIHDEDVKPDGMAHGSKLGAFYDYAKNAIESATDKILNEGTDKISKAHPGWNDHSVLVGIDTAVGKKTFGISLTQYLLHLNRDFIFQDQRKVAQMMGEAYEANIGPDSKASSSKLESFEDYAENAIKDAIDNIIRHLNDSGFLQNSLLVTLS
ncbi:hypothetical protein IWX48DRAFT_639493 [Phyllosticta citricarpa]